MGIPINSVSIPRRVSSNGFVGMSVPNWGIIPHKDMQTQPKAELIRQIKELGIKMASAVSDKEKNDAVAQFQKLSAQYMSAVSPDRNTLYREAQDEINKMSDQKQLGKKFEGQKTLLDFLNEHDGYGIKNGKAYPLACGGAVTPIYNSQGGYSFDISSKGEVVMSIDPAHNSVTYTRTAAEATLGNEAARIFWGAMDSAKTTQNNDFSTGGVDFRA
ncbi:hypothetical protein NSQ82_11210 [Caldifermentibacillus hisashii]|uniref:hypothetical protein n=1 Tax=Caldifermentibacillus hisashii TaxID=996558 RepID=UPI0031B6EA4C